jgi:hypothetical protein
MNGEILDNDGLACVTNFLSPQDFGNGSQWIWTCNDGCLATMYNNGGNGNDVIYVTPGGSEYQFDANCGNLNPDGSFHCHVENYSC